MIDATTNNPINIIGHSMGGAIAQKIALKRPDLIKTLFLVSSFAKADQICIRFLQSREMLVKAGLNKDMIANSVMPSIFANDFLSIPENIDIIIERFRNNTQTPAGLSGQLRAIEDHNTTENLKHIKTQTKIITGKNDVLVSPEHSFFLHRHISNSLIFEIENCGHMVQMEKRVYPYNCVNSLHQAVKSIRKFDHKVRQGLIPIGSIHITV